MADDEREEKYDPDSEGGETEQEDQPAEEGEGGEEDLDAILLRKQQEAAEWEDPDAKPEWPEDGGGEDGGQEGGGGDGAEPEEEEAQEEEGYEEKQ